MRLSPKQHQTQETSSGFGQGLSQEMTQAVAAPHSWQSQGVRPEGNECRSSKARLRVPSLPPTQAEATADAAIQGLMSSRLHSPLHTVASGLPRLCSVLSTASEWLRGNPQSLTTPSSWQKHLCKNATSIRGQFKQEIPRAQDFQWATQNCCALAPAYLRATWQSEAHIISASR